MTRSLSVRATGTSMGPLIRHDACLRLVPAAAVGRGDIIVFCHEGSMIVHRVIDRWHQNGLWEFLTKGDAMPRHDGLVCQDALLGKVVGICRRDGSHLRLTTWPWSTAGKAIAALGQLEHRLYGLACPQGIPGTGTIGRLFRSATRAIVAVAQLCSGAWRQGG